MPTCPHCGNDTTAERPARPGTVDSGGQLYRQRKQGARILSGEEGTDVTPNQSWPTEAV